MLGGAFKRLKGLCRTQAGIGGHLLRILQTKQTDEKSSVDLCTAVGRTYQGEEAAGRAAKLIDRPGSFKGACNCGVSLLSQTRVGEVWEIASTNAAHFNYPLRADSSAVR